MDKNIKKPIINNFDDHVRYVEKQMGMSIEAF